MVVNLIMIIEDRFFQIIYLSLNLLSCFFWRRYTYEGSDASIKLVIIFFLVSHLMDVKKTRVKRARFLSSSNNNKSSSWCIYIIILINHLYILCWPLEDIKKPPYRGVINERFSLKFKRITIQTLSFHFAENGFNCFFLPKIGINCWKHITHKIEMQ